jgi:hypothetical protein
MTTTLTPTGASCVVSFTRPSDTNIYAANDVMGTATATTAALSFTALGSTAAEVMITSAALEMDITAVPSGMTSFRLYLYSIAPPSALGDNVAWDLASNDRPSYLGYIDLGTPVDLGSTLYVEANGINKQVRLSGTGLFGYLVTNSGYTPASGAVTVITLHTLTI